MHCDHSQNCKSVQQPWSWAAGAGHWSASILKHSVVMWPFHCNAAQVGLEAWDVKLVMWMRVERLLSKAFVLRLDILSHRGLLQMFPRHCNKPTGAGRGGESPTLTGNLRHGALERGPVKNHSVWKLPCWSSVTTECSSESLTESNSSVKSLRKKLNP